MVPLLTLLENSIRQTLIPLSSPGPQRSMQFLEAYTKEDIAVAELEGSSNSLWTISPPSRKNLMDVLSKDAPFPVTMSWSIQRYHNQEPRTSPQ